MKRFTRAGVRRLGLAGASLASLEAAVFYALTWIGVMRSDLHGPDFFSFHSAARLFLARGGEHVYELAAQKEFQDQVTSHWSGGPFILLPYIHPPYYTALIAPLGYLDFHTAYIVWALINVVLAVVVVAVLVRANDLRGLQVVVAVAIAAGFLPLFVTLLQGQSDLVMLAPLAGSYYAWTRGRFGLAGVLAGFAMVKPQMLLLIPLLFLARRAWTALAGFGAVAAAFALLSLASFGPGGIVKYASVIAPWAVGGEQVWPITGQTVYSLRGLLEHLPGGRLPALFLLAILLALVALSLLWQPNRPRLDFALAVAGSVALSPYQNLHDLVLMLLPGFALAGMITRRQVRYPVLGGVVLVLAAFGTDLTLYVGSLSAAAAVLLLAGYLVAERLAVRPERIPVGHVEWSGPRPRRVIVLPAYDAARTLKEVVGLIPAGHADRILLVDDASRDATVSVASALRLDVIRHERNLGYGGNQKTCYRTALEMGADVVVMLHPDGQYDPAVIPALCRVIEEDRADIVLGSRWLGIDPAHAGMPWWKRLGNRGLTWTENRVLGLELSEFHTGYRAYSRRFLQSIPFQENSNDFVFDSQVLIQAAAFGFRFGEVPAVGRYFEDMSSISWRVSVVYGLQTLGALLRYVLHRAGFRSRWLTPPTAALPIAGQSAAPV